MISTVLLLAIMISVSGAMLAWGIPTLQRNEALASYSATLGTFEGLEAQMEAVITQGEGASRSAGVSTSAGVITLNGKSDQWLMIWTYVSWAELSFRDFGKEQTGFSVMDLTRPAGTPPINWKINLFWPENSTSMTRGLTGILVDFGVELAPPLNGTVEAANGTLIGGFRWFHNDAIKYVYPSVGGSYSINLLNGGLMVKEPGIRPRVYNAPLVVSQEENRSLNSILLNLVRLNSSTSQFNTAASGNFFISMTNSGAEIVTSESVYSLKMQFLGSGRRGWLSYFRGEEGFLSTKTSDEVGRTQNEPFQLLLIETEVQVRLGFR